MEGVWSIWVRLRAHLPRNKDSVTGELRALTEPAKPGCKPEWYSLFCHFSLLWSRRSACEQSNLQTGGAAENAKTQPGVYFYQTHAHTDRYELPKKKKTHSVFRADMHAYLDITQLILDVNKEELPLSSSNTKWTLIMQIPSLWLVLSTYRKWSP